MTDHATTIDLHLAAYCDPDPATRLDKLTKAWAPDGALVDPPIDGTGPEQIAGLVDVVLAHYPGHRFVRTTAVDGHHDYARYGWSLVDPDGAPAVTGTDVAQFDGEGRLVRIVGFFGPLPDRED